jgi:hypothetical protein
MQPSPVRDAIWATPTGKRVAFLKKTKKSRFGAKKETKISFLLLILIALCDRMVL